MNIVRSVTMTIVLLLRLLLLCLLLLLLLLQELILYLLFSLRGGECFLVRTQHFFHIQRRKLMRIFTVRSTTCRTQPVLTFPNFMPTPDTHLIPAFTRIKFTIAYIHFLAT